MLYLVAFDPPSLKLLETIQKDLKTFFHMKTEIHQEILPPPHSAFSFQRNQVNGGELLKFLWNYFKPAKNVIIFGLSGEDMYVEGMNFIFGLGSSRYRIGLVSWARLDPQFWGERWNEERRNQLLVTRTLKEAKHELCHVLGLDHCPNKRCLMSFSNTLAEADAKYLFCSSCHTKLTSRQRAASQ